MIEKARRFLLATVNLDGGWPYVPGKPSAPEPTSYAAMALWSAQPGKHDARQGAVSWMTAYTSLSSPRWTQSLALLVLSRLETAGNQRNLIIQDLLAAPVQQMGPRDAVEVDGQLRGWAWVDNTFSWVEPTSYALLALKSARVAQNDRPDDHKEKRIREAERLLLDRVCSDGGWNYGKPMTLGVAIPSMMPTTALAAMALQGAPGSGPVAQRAMNLLEREVVTNPSALALALTALCFCAYDRPLGQIAPLLAARQQVDGSWRGQVHLTALALLALRAAQEGTNVFKV
jgi:hypothetical protein